MPHTFSSSLHTLPGLLIGQMQWKPEAKNSDNAVTEARLPRTQHKMGRDERGSGGADTLQSQETLW